MSSNRQSITLRSLFVALVTIGAHTLPTLGEARTITDPQEIDAQIDALLKEAHAAYDAGDFQRAKKIAKDVRYKKPVGSRLEDANKLYLDSHQAFKNLKYVMNSPTPFILMEQIRLPNFGPELYKDFSVDLEHGDFGSIRGKEYSALQMKKYYELSGSTEASEMASQGLRSRRMGKVFLFWSMGMGAVAGFGGGMAYVAANSYTDSVGLYRMGTMLLGALGGLVTGTAVGLVPMNIYFGRSESQFNKAGTKFNEYLKRELRMSVGPVSGGVAGNLNLAF